MLRRLIVITLVVLLAVPAAMAGSSKRIPRKPKTKGIVGALQPTISPDGKQIAFTYHGDIWLVARKGGNARHLTLNVAYDFKPCFAPDGRHIAFTSNRGGNYDVYITTVEGETPRRLTFHSAADVATSWTSDGKGVVFYSRRGGKVHSWVIPLTGGTPKRLTELGGSYARLSKDGRKILYARGYVSPVTKQYKGSGNWQIFLGGVREVPKQITKFEGNDTYPCFSGDEKHIYYISERKGTYNLFRTTTAGGDGKQVTFLKGDGMSGPSYCPATNEFIFEYKFQLHSIKPGDKKPELVVITANTDTTGHDIIKRHVTEGAEHPCYSPTGKSIVFSLRGDIWVMPSSGGVAKQLTKGPEQDQWPRISPDNSKCAYFTNKNGNSDIYILDLKTKKTRQLTKNSRDEFFHAWSPDGATIVFCREAGGNKDIWTINVKTGEEKQLTTAPGSDDDPSFSPDGKGIIFDSSRGGTQDIWKMNTDGSNKRRLTSTAGMTQVAMLSADGKFLVYESVRNRTRGIWVMELATSLVMQVAPEGASPYYSPDGRTIAFVKGKGGSQQIYQIEAPKFIPQGKVISFIAETRIKRADELKEVFEQAHLIIKDAFYDHKYHGVNWDAMKRKYMPLATASETKDEFRMFISRMLGELKASHLGIGAPRSERITAPETGELGLELSSETGISGMGIRVKSVMPGMPADKAWIRPGDYIFAIERTRITRGANLFKALEGTVGKDIRVLVGSNPNRSDARTVTVTPTGYRTLRSLRYRSWVKKNSRKVDRATRGKVAYIHISAMMQPNLQRFQAQMARIMKSKKALILDMRNNPGGNIHQQVLDILSRKPFGQYRRRGGKMTEQPNLYWGDRPVVVLINQRSVSDAEVFTCGFKALGLGEVIGVPTMGGVIGTVSARLADGSSFRVPRVGWFKLDGTCMEGTGAKPTIHVAETPEDMVKGRDPQLKKAIEVILGKMSGPIVLKPPVVKPPKTKPQPMGKFR